MQPKYQPNVTPLQCTVLDMVTGCVKDVPGLVKYVAVAPVPGHHARTVSVLQAITISLYFNSLNTEQVNNCTNFVINFLEKLLNGFPWDQLCMLAFLLFWWD